MGKNGARPGAGPHAWEACLLLAGALAKMGPKGVTAARALVLQFDAYLRPSEVLSVTRDDVTTKKRGTSLAYPDLVLTLAPQGTPDQPPTRRTKGGRFDESVVVADKASKLAGRGFVGQIVQNLIKRRRAQQKLFDLTLAEYEDLFRKAMLQTSLGPLSLVPHSARHGGPSTDAALQLRDATSIQRRGRWESERSVRRYEKHGKLTRQVALMSSEQLADAKSLERSLPRLLGSMDKKDLTRSR